MKDITEYTDGMSEFELFSFMCDKIVSKEITSFSKLKELVAPALRDKSTHPALMRAFELMKRLYWGFFASLTPKTHKKLWEAMVVQDKDFPDAGDLKETLQVSNLYVAMLDIHGYTKFCMESRKNLSMAHALDEAMDLEVTRITAACHALSRRERGDEMVVLAGCATDVLTATLAIIDYFAKTTVLNDPAIPTKRNGKFDALPAFKISAGITGNFGSMQTPMITTVQGNLAGFLLNSGARLQMRANELSPKESRIMVAKQVFMSFQKENLQIKCSLVKNNALYFLDTGHIEFKGVMIPSYEVVFNKEDRYKERFSEELVRLFGSIRESLWEQRIFLDLMDLLAKTANAMPKFSVIPPVPINGMQTITNESFMQLCRITMKAYIHDEDYPAAVGLLQNFITIIELIPGFDRLILDYLKGVMNKYALILDSYQVHIDKEIDEKAAQIFQGQYYKTWIAAKNGAAIYEKLRGIGRKSNDIAKKKNLWYNLIKQNKEEMEFTLYSGKK
ncbi:hypothetical protein AGMMS50293_24520 [Spirochaetia bacterium]|nr:hypothetical protein AGMMS50293_24520 [Spirochaetia bacterium]